MMLVVLVLFELDCRDEITGHSRKYLQYAGIEQPFNPVLFTFLHQHIANYLQSHYLVSLRRSLWSLLPHSCCLRELSHVTILLEIQIYIGVSLTLICDNIYC